MAQLTDLDPPSLCGNGLSCDIHQCNLHRNMHRIQWRPHSLHGTGRISRRAPGRAPSAAAEVYAVQHPSHPLIPEYTREPWRAGLGPAPNKDAWRRRLEAQPAHSRAQPRRTDKTIGRACGTGPHGSDALRHADDRQQQLAAQRVREPRLLHLQPLAASAKNSGSGRAYDPADPTTNTVNQ